MKPWEENYKWVKEDASKLKPWEKNYKAATESRETLSDQFESFMYRHETTILFLMGVVLFFVSFFALRYIYRKKEVLFGFVKRHFTDICLFVVAVSLVKMAFF